MPTSSLSESAAEGKQPAGARPDDAPKTPHARGVRRLVRAFRFSCEGLAAAWRGEEAFRLEMIVAAALVPLALLLPLAGLEKAALTAAVFFVPIVELLNSAIENTVDYVSRGIHPCAKRAKDIGSAAVLLAIVLAGCVWALVLHAAWQRGAFNGLLG